MISSELAILIGAVIGGSISILTNWIQQKSQSKREFKKLAFDMAITEYNRIYESLKSTGGKLMPLESFITYYLRYMEMVQDGKFDIKSIKELRKFRQELNSFYHEEFFGSVKE